MEHSQSEKTLFDQYKLGDLTLSNRIIMSSLTRCRADPKTGIPNDLHVKYYSQRAKAGLIFTEASPIDSSQPISGAACIETKEQVAGWKKVTDAVHENGGRIFLQLWHGGRTIDPVKTGQQNKGPSAISVKNFDKEGNIVEGPMPVEMTVEEIKAMVQKYKQAGINAKEAGFDGIEPQVANASLLDQFIRDGSNQRTDEYGGSAENRSRFILEVVDALIEVFGASRVAVKLSPVGRSSDMYDSNPIETYTYLISKLDERKIGCIQLTEPPAEFAGKTLYPKATDQIPRVCKQFREVFKGTIITNLGYNAESGLKTIQEGYADLVSFGKLWIANPDLVERIKNKWSFNPPDFKSFPSGTEKGYIDYPLYQVPVEKSETSDPNL